MCGYFFSPLMREGFCLTKSSQFFVAPAEAERRGEEVRKWWQRAAGKAVGGVEFAGHLILRDL